MENALIIFVRNQEKGKVKTRIAKDLGEDETLLVYKHLLDYTQQVACDVHCNRFVFYSEYIHLADTFDDHIYSKHLQEGENLGERMLNAFKKVFHFGCHKVCIIGSDCYELEVRHINEAFEKLDEKNLVIGPSEDGGYYLLGMKELQSFVFDEKAWGSASVLEDTTEAIDKNGLKYDLLEPLNDIDTVDDLSTTNILARIREEPPTNPALSDTDDSFS